MMLYILIEKNPVPNRASPSPAMADKEASSVVIAICRACLYSMPYFKPGIWQLGNILKKPGDSARLFTLKIKTKT